MINNIDHIAIKVTDLSMVCQALEDLGIPCKGIEQYDEVGMQIAFLGDGSGQTRIELLEATAQSSPIVHDPPGLHHLGLKVKNIEDLYEKMEKSDRYQLQGEIRQGAHSRIFFFKVTGQEEILFECVE